MVGCWCGDGNGSGGSCVWWCGDYVMVGGVNGVVGRQWGCSGVIGQWLFAGGVVVIVW